ncbi:MAG TPA: hypothetical protein VHO29_16350, partial [Marmoricola sp.]|nr:hypothetical protein [Marmoricola sp.]
MSELRGSAVNTAVRFALAAVGAHQLRAVPRTAFYDPPAHVPERPGTLIRSQDAKFYLDPWRLIRAPARAERVMYSSTDRLGRPI